MGTCTQTKTDALRPHSHQVQFYDGEDHLFQVVTDFFGHFFHTTSDDNVDLNAIIVARPRPIRFLKDRFVARGFRIESSERAGHHGGELLSSLDPPTKARRRVFFIDAARLLNKLTPCGIVESGHFTTTMNALLTDLKMGAGDSQKRSAVYAYGEMVDVLCKRGEHSKAFELEEVWNAFLATNDVSLLCGYRMDSFRDQLLAPVFQQICRAHAIVSPTESYSTLGTVQQQMVMVAALQQNIKSLEAVFVQTKPRASLKEQQMRYREQFVDMLCHELRNPLSGIIGNVDLLKTGLVVRNAIFRPFVDSEAEVNLSGSSFNALRHALRHQLADDTESVDAIAICAEHMKTVTDDLLSLSKLESGKVVLEMAQFDPKVTLSSVVKMFSTLAAKKGITILLDLPPEVPVVVGDAGRLAQIIINLISNAVKFTDDGAITLGFRTVEPCKDSTIFEVTVRDTGIGMTEEERSMLFGRFSQPVSTSFAKYGGSGLGLYISKYLIELMGGVLWVESQSGKGSKFTFTFQAKEAAPLRQRSRLLAPVQQNTDQHNPVSNNIPSLKLDTFGPLLSYSEISPLSISATPPPDDPGTCRVRHVLLVDDNPVNLRVITRLLESEGLSVTTATNGYEAIGTLIKLSTSASPVDMVLMDLEMPFMNGISAVQEIRRLHRQAGKSWRSKGRSEFSRLPVIGLTGHVREERRAEARKAGMDDCIGKPVMRKALVELIKWVQSRDRSHGRDENGEC